MASDPPQAKLTLYVRKGDSLCDHILDFIAARDVGELVKVVDVDENANQRPEWLQGIPTVLTTNQEVLMRMPALQEIRKMAMGGNKVVPGIGLVRGGKKIMSVGVGVRGQRGGLSFSRYNPQKHIVDYSADERIIETEADLPDDIPAEEEDYRLVLPLVLESPAFSADRVIGVESSSKSMEELIKEEMHRYS